MQWILVVFGCAFVLAISAIIIVPYVRRRSDLLTGWNLFLLGSINFVGISAIQSGLAPFHRYTVPLDSDYVRFVLGAIIFYLVGTLTYGFFPLPKQLARNRFRKWGSSSTVALLTLAAACFILVLGYLFVPNIQFLGQFLIFFGMNASTFGIVFLLKCWYRRPFNLILLALCCVPFLSALIISNLGYGRREFLAVLLTIPLCLYWWRWRYYSSAAVLARLTVLGAVGVVALAGVTVTRSVRSSPHLSVVQVAIEKLRSIPNVLQPSAITETIVGGDTTEASLAAIRYYATEGRSQPFYLMYYVAVHPVPRAWWDDKPVALGKTLPVNLGLGYGPTFTVGPGIVGHGFHEGGILILAFYGFAFAAAFRFFDEILIRESENPFVVGIFCAVSGHVLGFSRGDVGLFIVFIIAGMLTGILLSTISRILFGTEVHSELAAPDSVLQPAHVYSHDSVQLDL